MKYAIIIIVLFSILAITFTATMINVNKTNNSNLNKVNNINEVSSFVESSSDKSTENVVTKPKEKTLDLLGTYNDNDLEIDTKSITIQGIDSAVNVPQIYGLKNKEVEEKINKDIEKRIAEVGEEAIGLYDKYNKIEFYSNLQTELRRYSNFANVISFPCYYSASDDNESKTIPCYLNYELINGNRLILDDLFTSDTDIVDILRILLYRYNNYEETVNFDFNDYYEDTYFDSNNNTWLVKHNYMDFEKDEWIETIDDYVPLLTEYEIEKLISIYLKSNRENFYFTPTRLQVDFKNDISSHLFLKDYPDILVIYDKYLTKESLFERDDLGAKDMVTCSAEGTDWTKHSIIESDNFFYDYRKFFEFNSPSSLSSDEIDYYNNKEQEIINKYSSEAKANPNKSYFLFIDYDTRSDGLESKLIIEESRKRNEMIKQIFDIYRYHNIIMNIGAFENIDLNKPHGVYGNLLIESDTATYEEKVYTYDPTEQSFNNNNLDIEELRNMSKEDLNLLYNEIFARYGHDFKTPSLKEYFSSFDWYTPIEGKSVTMEELSEVDRQNAELIRRVINEK